MKLPLEKIKELFPIGYLDHRKTNWVTNCPECKQQEFSISIEDNHLCGCFRGKCGFKGNIFTLMKKIGRVDVLINKDIKFDKLEQIKLIKEEEELDLNLPDIIIPMGWKRLYFDEYLNSRNFNEYDRYKVGFTEMHPKLTRDYIVFLIEEEGNLKGYIGRNRRSKSEIEKINAYYKKMHIDKRVNRYINSSTDFAKLVFGIDEITENTTTLIIVEGIFDKFNIDRLLNLHDQEEIKCIATFKCAVSKEQIYKIQQRGVNINTTILLYDNDVIDSIKQAAFELKEYLGNVLIGYWENEKDPGDFNEEDIQGVLADLQTPTHFNVNKVNLKKLII